MPLFSYTARNASGSLVQGSINAPSVKEARASLTALSLSAEELHETTMWEVIPPLEEPAAPQQNMQHVTAEAQEKYYPLIDTLRLYAGWLLAYHILVYALASYQRTRPLPFEIPFIEALFLSPLVLSFTIGAFLLLLLSSIQRTMGGGNLRGFFITLLGLLLFVFFEMSV